MLDLVRSSKYVITKEICSHYNTIGFLYYESGKHYGKLSQSKMKLCILIKY